MQSGAVVEAHNVVSHIGHSLAVVGVVLLPDPLHLQVQEETLHDRVDRVVPTVSTPAHTGDQVVVFAPAVEVIAAKLASLVEMNHHRGCRASAPNSHRERVQNKLCGHGAVQILYPRRIQVFLKRWHMLSETQVHAEKKV